MAPRGHMCPLMGLLSWQQTAEQCVCVPGLVRVRTMVCPWHPGAPGSPSCGPWGPAPGVAIVMADSRTVFVRIGAMVAPRDPWLGFLSHTSLPGQFGPEHHKCLEIPLV